MPLAPSVSPWRPTIASYEDLADIRRRIEQAADGSLERLMKMSGDGLSRLHRVKFERIGNDPLTGSPMNFIEQLNQTFTVLTSLSAVAYLLRRLPNAGGFQLSLGTSSGRDIASVVPNLLAAEVFSATHHKSNKKLDKEIARLRADDSTHRMVFFAAPTLPVGRHSNLEPLGSGIEVHRVDPLVWEYAP